MACVMRHRSGKHPSKRPAESSRPPRNPSMYDCVVLDDGKGDNKPAPRSGHRIVAEEGFVYCFGGYNPTALAQPSTFGLFPELWRYSLSTRKWSRMPNDECPEETASHSMICLGESLMVWGGTGFPFGDRCSNTLSAYHIPSNRWHTVQCGGEIPSPRYGQSLTYKEGAVYVIGGTTGYNYNMKVHKLNLETLNWDAPQPPSRLDDDSPPPRYRHEIATSGNWIYVLGGGTAQVVFNFEIIPAYNVQTKLWEIMQSRPCPVDSYPLPRKFHAAVQHGNYAYLCGGFDGGSKMFDDIWRLDLATLQWAKLSQTLPRPIYFHSATVTPAGCMVVFGGVISTSGDERSNEVVRIWLNVPSLQELTWEFLTTKHHEVFEKHGPEGSRHLRQLGINLPPKYSNRLK